MELTNTPNKHREHLPQLLIENQNFIKSFFVLPLKFRFGMENSNSDLVKFIEINLS